MNHSLRAKQIKTEMEKLRQRLDKAQQLMLDGEMKMDEYRKIKSKTGPEINYISKKPGYY